jgi:hypothetical protein
MRRVLKEYVQVDELVELEVEFHGEIAAVTKKGDVNRSYYNIVETPSVANGTTLTRLTTATARPSSDTLLSPPSTIYVATKRDGGREDNLPPGVKGKGQAPAGRAPASAATRSCKRKATSQISDVEDKQWEDHNFHDLKGLVGVRRQKISVEG